MAFYLLLPGAGGASFYWHGVVARLEAAGHDAVAVDFPSEDERAGLPEYAAIAVAAARGRSEVIVVAQSLGGFSAPVVASALPTRRIVLVNAMIPRPGETAGEWGDHTGSAEPRRRRAEQQGYSQEFTLETYFLHDISAELAARMKEHDHDEAKIAFTQPADFESWPDVPIEVIIGEDDRLFPADFQERVARERLGASVEITRIKGGHLVGLSEPELVASRLLAGQSR